MIKKLDKSNIKDVLSLFSRSEFLDGYNENMLNGAYSNEYFISFGEFIDDRLISYVCGTKSLDGFDLEDIVVDKEKRNTGRAKNLINYLFTELKNEGVREVFLEVRESNLPAIKLYKSFEFNLINKRLKYYSDGETALIYKKDL